LDENREYSTETWEDSRLVWLPLQFVLLPEEHDTQREIDAIIEKFVNVSFTDGNHIWYIINEEFQWELARQIHSANDYHVLWIHDVDGYDAKGNPDTLSFLQVKGSYLAAMTKRIKEYDQTGKFPTYMIFLDQVFYESNKGRLWMNLLEDPLDYNLSLSDEAMEKAIKDAQNELRSVVAGSKLLKAETEQYGRKWLKNLIKVHVNITNPADNSFWNNQVIPIIGTPDNIMRDHRKIAFYDICEENPYKGMAIYTGMGVGEHYSGATWDDRAMMVRGPATLNLKYAAINLMQVQGFEDNEIPFPIRRRAIPDEYFKIIEDTINAYLDKGIFLARAMELHNQTGFYNKNVTLLKALLFNLLPKGTISYTPDSLWNSALFAALLVGNALRGGIAAIIAPSLECAPSAGFPQMSRAQGLFARLIVIQDKLGEEIRSAGGILRTSMYDPEVDVADIPGMIGEFEKYFKSDPEISNLYDFHPSMYGMLDSMQNELSKIKPIYLTSDAAIRRAKLHAKINMFISVNALKTALARPEFTDVMRVYLRQKAESAAEITRTKHLFEETEELRVVVYKWLNATKNDLTDDEREKLIMYLQVGTMNHDYMSMMLNGEAVILISGWQSVNGLIDIIFKSGLAKNVHTLEELNKYLPPYSSMKRWIGDWIKFML
jgi:phosphatidylserine/phosphatidylglycerophosphate/cardiolipin synthase-like enzyme